MNTQANRHYTTELSTTDHIILKLRRKVTFNFTDIKNDQKMRQKLCQSVRFISFYFRSYTHKFQNTFTIRSYAVYLAITMKKV